MKLNMGSSESIDIESSDNKKKIPICERCWLFKRNKNFIQRKCSRGRGSPQNFVNRYDEHKRFLARLVEFQKSLPQEKMEQPVVVNQLASDDSTDIKNIFVNNIIRHNSNINLKAIAPSTANKKKEQNNSLSSRSLRLNRKCKVNHIIRDECDDDFLLGKNTLSEQKEANKNTHIVHANNGEVGKTVSLKNKIKIEENSSNPLDELLGDTGFEPVKNKKRKVEGSNTFISDVRNMTKQFISKMPVCDSVKRYTKKTVNGEAKENPSNVIEIDGESGEKETVSSNREETNKNSKVSCPMCSKFFTSDEINNHAYTCQGPQTQTRSKQSKNDSKDNLRDNYDETAWKSACKGLDIDGSAMPKKEKDPVEHVDLVSETNICRGNECRTTSINSKQNFKILEDPLKDVKVSSKLKCENTNEQQHVDNQLPHCENKQSRLMTAKISGYRNLAHNQSTQDLIESYAKTIHKIRNPPAKQMRSFGEHRNDEHEMVKCGRCEQYVADDQLKAHTDNCFEKSMLIE